MKILHRQTSDTNRNNDGSEGAADVTNGSKKQAATGVDKSKVSIDWSAVAEESATVGDGMLPTIPQWNIRVNGKNFQQYLSLARQSYV